MTTLPGNLLTQAAARPGDVALRHKRLGRWTEITWSQYAERVARVAAGLQALGVSGGERVVIQADNRPEWVIADLAAQAIGAITIGVSPEAPASSLQAVLEHSGACALIAEDEEQIDKAMEVRAEAPLLRRIVVVDGRGVRCLDDERVSTWAELAGAEPVDLEALVAGLDPTHPAIAVYSGSKEGATIDHASIVSAGHGFGASFDATAGDCVVSCMPLSELAERLFSVAIALDAGYTVHFGERAGTLGEDLREVQPTLLHSVAGVWEHMNSNVTTRMASATRLKRGVHGACVRRGNALAGARMSGSLSLTQRAQALVCSALVFGTLREKLGLSRLRVAVCSGEPLAPDARAGLLAIGVGIVEVGPLDVAGLLGTGAAA